MVWNFKNTCQCRFAYTHINLVWLNWRLAFFEARMPNDSIYQGKGIILDQIFFEVFISQLRFRFIKLIAEDFLSLSDWEKWLAVKTDKSFLSISQNILKNDAIRSLQGKFFVYKSIFKIGLKILVEIKIGKLFYIFGHWNRIKDHIVYCVSVSGNFLWWSEHSPQYYI